MDLNKGHRDRLRQRFMIDFGESMPDYEILELLLMNCIARCDVKPIAKRLLTEFGSISAVFGADVKLLQSVQGVGEQTAVMIKVIQRSTHLVIKKEIHNTNILNSWDKLIEYCYVYMAHSPIEQFRVVYLNSRNRVIRDEEQTRGTVNETSIYPREVIKRALDLNATAIILVHNHPSGDTTPSKADIRMTHEVIEAGLAMKVKVHDHVIITKEGYASLKNMGLI